MPVQSLYSAQGGLAVTASDSNNFSNNASRGINVTTAGAYKFTMADGTTPTLNLIAGVIHPIACLRVWSTGAASTSGIVAVF